MPFGRRRARPDAMDSARTEALQLQLDEVPWAELTHAYGAASDVPALLLAVFFGTDTERGRAWWELWGNVHHQGTVYPATARVVPFIERIAGDRTHPDRVQAISFLQALAEGDGSASAQVRVDVEAATRRLMAEWSSRTTLDQRALLWLAASFPEQPWHELATNLLPLQHLEAWREALGLARLRHEGTDAELEELYNDDEYQDRGSGLETWLLEGWVELPSQ